MENPVEDQDLEIIARMRALSEELEVSHDNVSAILTDGVKLIHRLDEERRRFDNYYRAVSMAFRSSQMREMRGSFSHEDFDVMISKICGDTYPDAMTTFKGE